MKSDNANNTDTPRIETTAEIAIAGYTRSYKFSDPSQIPAQWANFAQQIPQLTSIANPETFGIIYNGSADNFDYLTGIEVSAEQNIPDSMTTLQLGSQTYAVYQHSDNVATLGHTCGEIWSERLPASGYIPVQAPWFERYGDSFDPTTGDGGMEVWIPIEQM